MEQGQHEEHQFKKCQCGRPGGKAAVKKHKI